MFGSGAERSEAQRPPRELPSAGTHRELTPAARRRGLYLIDSYGTAGVLFPAAFVPDAAYKASLRVQSERSERLRELPSAGARRKCPWGARTGGTQEHIMIL